ncbi:hypothetical protein CC2G_002431 [Coprinopsis cinerea AmutBmut pab1-1]|nr:hypothetical protein CC2G_002431 [Coprinopsis cinerea AmutBmut pab1-1]
MPELWSRICVAFPTTSDYRLLHMWLERSGTHPLDLTIVHSEGRYPNDGIVHALRILLDEEHRWKYLSLTLGEGVDRLFEQSTVSCTFPLLETLDIDLRDWNEDVAAKFCRRIHGTPSLTRLRQDSFWKHVSITPSIPWSVLQDVELNALEARELKAAFSQGLRLQRLVLHHVVGTVDRSSPTPLTLPCLRTLGLGSIEDVSQILRMVALPALHELHLLGGIGWPCTTRAAHDVLQEIERFGCRLEKLALNLGRNADEDILITILQSPVMVHLKALAVRSKTTSRLLQFLTASSSSPLALPALEHLLLPNLHSNDGELRDMVQSRVEYAGGFRAVEHDGLPQSSDVI